MFPLHHLALKSTDRLGERLSVSRSFQMQYSIDNLTEANVCGIPYPNELCHLLKSSD